MPVVSVKRDELFNRLGDSFGSAPGEDSKQADEKFQELCFSFGIELDAVTTEEQEKSKGMVSENSDEKVKTNDILYKIEIPANRYELLCLEGIARSLRVFLGKEEPPIFKVSAPKTFQKMIIKPETQEVRSVVLCAVLRGVKFTPSNYASFIDLQDKLHRNICRRRRLASIGTHDLDLIQGPFTYEARKPEDINFIPLNRKKSVNGHGLMEELSNDLQLREYLDIIRNKPKYPVIYDARGEVLSLPPIINSEYSKISLKTQNVFIEVTGTDYTKTSIVLETMCAMFSEYCSDRFTIEPVEIHGADNQVSKSPKMQVKKQIVETSYINKSIGISISPQQIIQLLKKLSLEAEVNPSNPQQLQVSIPPTRSDILHPCDIMEDVAIAYGFDNIQWKVPDTPCFGKQTPVNKFSDQLRREIAMCGYSEILTFGLCSKNETFAHLRRPPTSDVVTILNPKTTEFQVARLTLLSGMLKTIASNKHMPIPLRLFEVSDVVSKANTDVGAKNTRKLIAVDVDSQSHFEVISGLLDRVMQLLSVKWKEVGIKEEKGTDYYWLEDCKDPSFMEGKRANIMYNGQAIGVIGILHPEVLENFEVTYPVTALEMNIEPFL